MTESDVKSLVKYMDSQTVVCCAFDDDRALRCVERRMSGPSLNVMMSVESSSSVYHPSSCLRLRRQTFIGLQRLRSSKKRTLSQAVVFSPL